MSSTFFLSTSLDTRARGYTGKCGGKKIRRCRGRSGSKAGLASRVCRIYREFTVPMIRLLNPYRVFTSLSQRCDTISAAIYNAVLSGESSYSPRTRLFLAGVAVLPFQAVVGAHRLITEEIADWVDLTNFADHLALVGRNPIPDSYYTQGDCLRFSGVYLGGDTKAFGPITPEQVIGIKGRFAVLGFIYSLFGLS